MQTERDVLTLCLRLCLEPADSHSPDTRAVLERYRPAWEAMAGGTTFEDAWQLLPAQQPDTVCVPRAKLDYLLISTAYDGQWADRAVHQYVTVMLSAPKDAQT